MEIIAELRVQTAQNVRQSLRLSREEVKRSSEFVLPDFNNVMFNLADKQLKVHSHHFVYNFLNFHAQFLWLKHFCIASVGQDPGNDLHNPSGFE